MLTKAIINKKEKRKPYRKAAAFDRSCRNHGGCNFCLGNRTYSSLKRKASVDEKIKEHINENF